MTNIQRPSRREALGLGLGVIGGTAFAGSATASAAMPTAPMPTDGAAGGGTDGGTDSVGNSTIARIEVAAPTTAGTEYVTYEGFAFGDTGGTPNTGNFGELVTTAAADYFTVHIDVPNGSTITEIVWYFDKFAASSITCRLVRIQTSNPSGNGPTKSWTEITNSNTNAAPISAAVIQTLIQNPPTIAPGPALVDTTAYSYLLIANMPLGATRLMGARVGFQRPVVPPTLATSFYPLSPGRVYDSRWVVFGSAKIASGENRTISVKDRRRISPDDGTVDLADFVPVGAKAIAYNLTVADTVGGGFLATTPGDAATFGTSTINWTLTGTNLANGTVVSLDVNRAIKVFAGGGALTHFLVDIVGYYA
jgi:hypothetical protein